ncbi:MAG TPA: 2-oxo-4-hydroxy-4-carboxy-5-ureidoimidazoline decarboxylase [Sandaracinaceae bacterium LLY-WYZ-13_1]|nr:2-oxo-4-hydroxy-4-carboxy-5-ureidoimidazoline decarboxylase [Sandaracinaceae bacterium LLY-WYZ-13_1]
MSDPAAILDAMTEGAARAALTRCCGASRWVEGMLARRPFGDREALLSAAREVWATMERDDVLEAFAHHPRIGADLSALRTKFAATKDWSADEQGAVRGADEATLEALRDGNVAYERRFGHLFIVCATGKRADEMLALLEARLPNEPDEELAIAAAEQMKITELRLLKLERSP